MHACVRCACVHTCGHTHVDTRMHAHTHARFHAPSVPQSPSLTTQKNLSPLGAKITFFKTNVFFRTNVFCHPLATCCGCGAGWMIGAEAVRIIARHRAAAAQRKLWHDTVQHRQHGTARHGTARHNTVQQDSAAQRGTAPSTAGQRQPHPQRHRQPIQLTSVRYGRVLCGAAQHRMAQHGTACTVQGTIHILTRAQHNTHGRPIGFASSRFAEASCAVPSELAVPKNKSELRMT